MLGNEEWYLTAKSAVIVSASEITATMSAQSRIEILIVSSPTGMADSTFGFFEIICSAYFICHFIKKYHPFVQDNGLLDQKYRKHVFLINLGHALDIKRIPAVHRHLKDADWR